MSHENVSGPHTGARTQAAGVAGACALLLVLGSGCDRAGQDAAVVQAPVSTASQAAPIEPVVDDARGTAGGDAAPVLTGDATDTEAASPTIAASSALATSREGGLPVLRDVRTGEHARADRIVFEFAGDGLPAWHVEYVDRPVRECGSGHAVPVAGDGWLQVRFTGAQAHTDAGVATSGPRRREVRQPVLLELVRLCDFEGQVVWVAGVATPNPYTPQVLADPSRLVIDIAH